MSITKLCSQEMANPHVRPHLHFYPEDTGTSISEYWHASHWHNEMNPIKITPMVLIHHQSFFVHEPCVLNDGRACMPSRWFIRNKKFIGKVWSLRAVLHDSRSAWIVEEYNEIEVSEDRFLVSFGSWGGSQSTNGLPPATEILGMIYSMKQLFLLIPSSF
jgi:hypothetical protein